MVGDSAYVDIVGASGIRLIIETDPENPSGALRCGRVEVQYKGGNPDYFDAPNGLSEGIWGTVCNDGFDDAEAEVVCRQMGISGGSRAISKPLYEQNRKGYIYDASYAKVDDMWKVRKCDICEAGLGPIFFTKTRCQGNEARLWDCPYKNTEVEYCDAGENAGVCCGGEIEDVAPDLIGDMPQPLFVILLLGLLFVLVLFGVLAWYRKFPRQPDEKVDDIEHWEETDDYGYPIYNFKVNRLSSSLPRPQKFEEDVAGKRLPATRFMEDPSYMQSPLPRQSGPISSVMAAAVRLVLRLNFRAVGDEGSLQRERFYGQLLHDLSQASGLPASSFLVKQLSPGSVVVDCEIYPDYDNPMSPDPESAARILEAQVHEPDSRLRAGWLTTFISSLTVSHLPGDDQVEFNGNFEFHSHSPVFPTVDESNRIPESTPAQGFFKFAYPRFEGGHEFQTQWAAPHQQHWPPPPREVLPSLSGPDAAQQGWVPLENAVEVSNYEQQPRQLPGQFEMMDGVAEELNYDAAPWQQWVPTSDLPLASAIHGMVDGHYDGVGPIPPDTIDFSQYETDRPPREMLSSRPPGRDIRRSASPRRSHIENDIIERGSGIWNYGGWERAKESHGRRKAGSEDRGRHRLEGATPSKGRLGRRDLLRGTSAGNRKGGRDQERKEGKGKSRTRRHRHESKQGRSEREEDEDMYFDGNSGLVRVPPAHPQLFEQQQQALRARMHHFKEEAEASKLHGYWNDAQLLPTPSILPAPPHRPVPAEAPPMFAHPVHSAIEEFREHPSLQPGLANPDILPHAHDIQAHAFSAAPFPHDASLPPVALAQETPQSRVIENGLPRLRYR